MGYITGLFPNVLNTIGLYWYVTSLISNLTLNILNLKTYFSANMLIYIGQLKIRLLQQAKPIKCKMTA